MQRNLLDMAELATSGTQSGSKHTYDLWLIQAELKRYQAGEEWLTVHYAEHFTLQLLWEL